MGKRTVYTCDKVGCTYDTEDCNKLYQVQTLAPGPVTRTANQGNYKQLHLCPVHYGAFMNWLQGMQLEGGD